MNEETSTLNRPSLDFILEHFEEYCKANLEYQTQGSFVIGLLMTFFTVVIYVPQIKELLFKTNSKGGISYFYLYFFSFSCLTYLNAVTLNNLPNERCFVYDESLFFWRYYALNAVMVYAWVLYILSVVIMILADRLKDQSFGKCWMYLHNMAYFVVFAVIPNALVICTSLGREKRDFFVSLWGSASAVFATVQWAGQLNETRSRQGDMGDFNILSLFLQFFGTAVIFVYLVVFQNQPMAIWASYSISLACMLLIISSWCLNNHQRIQTGDTESLNDTLEK